MCVFIFIIYIIFCGVYCSSNEVCDTLKHNTEGTHQCTNKQLLSDHSCILVMCDSLRLLGVAVLTTAVQEFTHLWPG